MFSSTWTRMPCSLTMKMASIAITIDLPSPVDICAMNALSGGSDLPLSVFAGLPSSAGFR